MEFLCAYDVVCPKCRAKAHVRVIGNGVIPLFAPRRLSCCTCGYRTEWRGNTVSSRFSEAPVDWYFGAPFWYRRRCCGHELWVANREHLGFLRSYVGAKIRSHVRVERRWSNRSLSGRLPRWMTAGDNRSEILRALDALEAEFSSEEKPRLVRGRSPVRDVAKCDLAKNTRPSVRAWKRATGKKIRDMQAGKFTTIEELEVRFARG